MKTIRIRRSEITEPFTTPPECQGQIVTLSYALCGDRFPAVVVEQTHDASDGEVTYTAYASPDDDEFEPWNGVPGLGKELGPVEIVED